MVTQTYPCHTCISEGDSAFKFGNRGILVLLEHNKKHSPNVGKATRDFTPEKLTIKKSCMARETGT